MKYAIGEVIFKDEALTINEKLPEVEVEVKNTGDRTIQVCSHYHFFECNNALVFNREDAYGMRLDIPAGTAIRFEPGEDRKVKLVPFTGERKLYGFAGMVMGELDDPKVKAAAMEVIKKV